MPTCEHVGMIVTRSAWKYQRRYERLCYAM